VPGRRGVRLATGSPHRRRDENGEEPGLEKQRVPLVAEEDLPHRHDRQIEGPEDDEHRNRREAEEQEQGQPRPTPAEEEQEAVARIQPDEGGQQEVALRSDVGADPVEELRGGQYAAGAHEPLDLDG
jgi:hypothetical protein